MKNYQWVKEEIEKILTAEVIHSTRFSWSAPIIVVPTGDGGRLLVIDYHALNKVTRKFTWNIPKVEDICSKLNGAKYFSTLDLWAGYDHVPLDKSSIPKTAFNSPFSKYEYVKVPFGLGHAPAYFQELMTGMLKDFDFAIAYLDDIIIFNRMAEEHLYHIKQVFEKLQAAKHSMKLSKCHFFSRDSIFRTHSKHKGHLTITFEDASHPENASTNTQTGSCFPWISRILQKIHQNFHENSQTSNATDMPARDIWLYTNPPWSLPAPQGIHHSSTYITLPWP